MHRISIFVPVFNAQKYLQECLEKLIERQKQTDTDAVLLQLNLFENETRQIIQKIPNDAFDSSQIMSGGEAVMLTIGTWHISINGLFLFPPKMISRIACVYSRYKRP